MNRKMFGLMLLMLAGAVSAADFSSWQQKMPITFTGYNLPGGVTTLTNFPALVVLSTNISGFSYDDFLSLTNQDLRFTASDETTELNYEIESWNTNGSSYVWVQTASLVDSNTAVWAHWGKPGTNALAYTTNGATWANGYIGVWHFATTNGAILDSTANGHAGATADNVNRSATGQVNGAFSFDGTDDHVGVAHHADLCPTNITVEAWVQPSVIPSAWKMIVTKGYDGTSVPYDLAFYSTSRKFMFGKYPGWVYALGSTVPTAGVRYHLVGTYDGEAFRLYENGRQDGITPWAGSLPANTRQLAFGDGDWNGVFNTFEYSGVIDEVRISSFAKSSNWVWATYMNQASNGVFTGSFNTYGSIQELDPNLPRIANGGLLSRTDTSAEVSGQLLTNGTSAATVFLYCSTNDCTTNASDWTASGSVTNLGAMANDTTFTNTLTGLASSTTYYWNHSASNASATVWAAMVASPSFKTLGAPGIDNGAGATDIGVNTATLSGCLTNGTAAHIFILQGTQDGVWTVTNDLGTLSEGAFSNTVSALSPGTTNYYTCYATNAGGVALATPSVTFVTAHGWTGLGTSSYASEEANWTGGLPRSGDTVVLDATTNKNMIWDAGSNGLPDTVTGWTQTTGYTGTVTIQTVYGATGFTNFTITGDASIQGGTWTHLANTTSEGYRLSLAVNGDLTVGAAAEIDATGLGYSTGNGPGTGNGAAHGGRSGSTNIYGSIFEPVNLGSGGGAGAGGGAIRLIVGGTLTLDGTVIASSVQAHDSRGAGGSVYITVGTLTGASSGIIRATGSLSSGTQATGSGGRIAVILTADGATFSGYAGLIRACGGKLGTRSGAAGTVYKETPAQGAGRGTLVIDNTDSVNMSTTTIFTPIPAGVDPAGFDEIIIRQNGMLGVTSGAILDFETANIVGESAALAHIVVMDSDAVAFPSPFAFSNYTLNINFPLETTGPWTIKSGGRLSHSAGQSLNCIINGDLIVDEGGQIHADSRNSSGGLGAGTTSGYGGLGGDPASMGATYGSVIAPVDRGSGTGGGGLITLVVSGVLTNNGTISAAAGGARAAGGGINITAGALAGTSATAKIQAPGGNGDNGYSGGGGRVAVVLTDTGADFSGYAGSISAVGGHSYYPRRGAAGTVYKAIAGLIAGGGSVLVDNAGYTNANLACLTRLPASSTSTEVLNYSYWTVQNKGKIGLVTNTTVADLTVNADSFLDLAGYTGTVSSLTIASVSYGAGAYAAADLGAAVTDSSGVTGKIIVFAPQGSMFRFR